MVEAGPRSESTNRRDRNGNINLRDHHNRQCAGDQDDADDVNTFKILVSTDNHLGFNEECPIRGDDSFVSFEEVLQLAQKEQVRAEAMEIRLSGFEKCSQKTFS